jgi:hypothetical protein
MRQCYSFLPALLPDEYHEVAGGLILSFGASQDIADFEVFSVRGWQNYGKAKNVPLL